MGRGAWKTAERKIREREAPVDEDVCWRERLQKKRKRKKKEEKSWRERSSNGKGQRE